MAPPASKTGSVSRTSRPGILSQTFLTFIGQSNGYIAAVVSGIVVARVLGPSGKGVVAYAAIVLGVFVTLANGIQQAVMYHCGHEKRAASEVHGAALLTGAVLVAIGAPALLVIALLDPAHRELAFAAGALPFAVYNQIACGFLLLSNDVRSTVIVGAFDSVGSASLTIPALLFFHAGVTTVLAIWVAMLACSATFAFVRVHAHVSPFSLRSGFKLLRVHAWYAARSAASAIASFLNLRIDVFVVGAMLAPRMLGIYTLAISTGELMWQLSRPLEWTTMGRIAAAGDEAAIELAARVSRMILAVQCVAGAVIFAVAPFAIRLVYGNAYAESGHVVRWLMPGLVLYAAQSSAGYFVAVKRGRPALMLAIQAASIAACAVITIMTIPRLGIYGAALATSITYCFVTVANSLFFARFTGVPARRFVLLQREDFAYARRLFGRRFARSVGFPRGRE